MKLRIHTTSKQNRQHPPKLLTTLALIAGLLLQAATSGWTQTTIHYWSFNAGENSELDAANDEPTSIPADIGDGVINHGLTFGAFSGSSVNAEPGYDAGEAFSPRFAANIGKSFEVVVSTTGYENISFSFAGRRTSAGYDNNTI